MRILIAEDDATSRSFLATMLEKHGHSVTVTKNGKEAWEAIQGIDAPKLIILDWLMPEIDGAEICRRVRAQSMPQQPYVIMLTVKGEKADIVSGLEAGADDYICKPFDPHELRARIGVGKRILELQASLAARIEEKELILRETHHRMKNNMNIMGSILDIQASTLKDTEAAAALQEARRRLLAMGILYDKLYRSKSVRRMSIKDYLPGLIDEIYNQFSGGTAVTIEKRIDDFKLGAKILTTLGIIINEIITNCMKHAFSAGEKGSIIISATKRLDRVAITIEDDGNGIRTPHGTEARESSSPSQDSSSFGLRLISLLMNQIDGTMTIESRDIFGKRGTTVLLEFQVDDNREESEP